MKNITEFILEAVEEGVDIDNIIKGIIKKLRNDENLIFVNVTYMTHVANKIINTLVKYGYNRDYITLYLDKAKPEDVDVADLTQGKIPDWVAKLDRIKGKKVLFIDMIRAKNEVMNAIMPMLSTQKICGEKDDNLAIIMFGEYDSLSKPLQSRFGTPIEG